LRASDGLLSAPLEILGAQRAGTGEKLARLIVETYDKSSNPETEEDPRPNFLYLTGDKNRETIPDVLSKAGFNYHKMQVYETFSASGLSAELVKVALQMQAGKPMEFRICRGNSDGDADSRGEVPDNEQWLALFSPSTASYVLEAWEAISRVEPTLRNSAFRLAAIGPTTDEYLTTHGHEVAAVSARPDAVSLADAICAIQGRTLADSISSTSGKDIK
jgi:uroporphyrinogen-III synthase